MTKKQKNRTEQLSEQGTNFYALGTKEALEKLSSKKEGLTQKEAGERLKKFGPNVLPEKKKKNPLLLFIKQFHSFLIYILLFAAAIAYGTGHMVDFYVVIFVVFFNAVMGFVQEYRAEKAVEALQNMMSPHARVYRDGQLHDIEAKDLVPGDIVHLVAGDKVPADVRIIDQSNLRTQEASLTGESAPISKNIDTLPPETGLADRKNMAWMGTFIADGQCDAVVVSTGSATAFGKIAESISKIKKQKSHFEKKTDSLAKKVAAFAVLGATVTFFVGFYVIEPKPEFAELLIFTLASLVSGIPEGLPAILVVVLAIGASRMAARNAIVKTLPAGETIGVADIIITDKTGTLTQNAMTVERVVISNDEKYSVTGHGWSSEGEFMKGNSEPVAVKAEQAVDLQKLLHISAVCNSATVRKNKEEYEIMGDPTEAGIAVLAQKAGLTKDKALEGKELIADFPFNQKLKYRSSIVEDGGKREFYIVGAPEVLLENSTHTFSDGKKQKLSPEHKKELYKNTEEMAKDALRVLGLAYREVSADTKKFSEDLASELVFVGLVGMKDPARPEVPKAIERAKAAGVKVIMATGDHKETAFAISKEIGLIDIAEDESAEGHVLTGAEVEKMSKRELKKAAREVLVFARLEPNTKLKLADALQKQGHVVAMTGDGVNDSPALKKADIGIAMGIIGTDVAREASKVILADDNFATIVNAIEEGRIIFNNVRISSTFLISTNVAEDFTIISSMLIFHQFPLLATQILWLNLVTDSAAGIPLATERAGNKKVLDHPPRSPKESILSGPAIANLVIVGAIMVIASVFVFGFHLEESIDKARTATFTVMAFTQIFHMLNLRSLRISVFKLGLFSNKFVNIGLATSVVLQIMVIYTPFFQNIFNFVSISPIEFIILVVISSFVLWIGEAYKVLQKKMGWYKRII